MRLEWKPAADDEIIGIDSLENDSLIVGNHDGKLCLTTKDPVAVHLKNDARLTSLFSISKDLALVFYVRSQGKTGGSIYQTPNLQSISGLTFYDVTGGTKYFPPPHSEGGGSSASQTSVSSREGNRTSTVIVFTPAALRLIEFNISTVTKARVVKTIEAKGVVAGCMSPDMNAILIASQSEYQLVDLTTDTKTPLFPILNNLKPLMASLGHDFLVVQGTGIDDPAMGLFVDKRGEVARSGIIVEWPAYPVDMVISGNDIFAVCAGTLIAHSIIEDEEKNSKIEQLTIKLPEGISVKRIFKLSNEVSFVHHELFARLGDEVSSRINTDVAFLLSNNEIELYEPEPQLLKLESEISKGGVSQIPRSIFPIHTETGRAQVDYLTAYLIIHILKSGPSADAIKAWRSATESVNSELILFIHGHRDDLPADIRPGLRMHAHSLRQSCDSIDREFLRFFIRSEIRRLRRHSDGSSQEGLSLRELEPLYARLLREVPRSPSSADHAVTRFLLERGQRSTTTILSWLRDEGDFEELRHYYSIIGDTSELSKLNLEVIRDPKATPSEIDEASKQLADFALSSQRPSIKLEASIDEWTIAMELLENPRLDNNLGIRVLTSHAFESRFDPVKILEVLKEITNSGLAWRSYLKHLVHTKGLLKNDLASLVVTDLIEFLEANEDSFRKIEESYEAFAEEMWPKPSYQVWIRSPKGRRNYPPDLLKIQIELWDLMEKGLDWVSLMPTFEAQLPNLKLERAVIYGHLGLLEQSLQLFKDITDFRSVLDCAYQFDESEMQGDVARLSLRTVLDVESPYQNHILKDFLTSRASRHLDVDLVLNSLSDSRPFFAVAEFLQTRINEEEARLRQARRRHALLKANLP